MCIWSFVIVATALFYAFSVASLFFFISCCCSFSFLSKFNLIVCCSSFTPDQTCNSALNANEVLNFLLHFRFVFFRPRFITIFTLSSDSFHLKMENFRKKKRVKYESHVRWAFLLLEFSPILIQQFPMKLIRNNDNWACNRYHLCLIQLLFSHFRFAVVSRRKFSNQFSVVFPLWKQLPGFFSFLIVWLHCSRHMWNVNVFWCFQQMRKSSEHELTLSVCKRSQNGWKATKH